jgi:hypothetical protein
MFQRGLAITLLATPAVDVSAPPSQSLQQQHWQKIESAPPPPPAGGGGAAVGLAPSIYWASAPTLVNETLLISGSGFDGAHISLCSGRGSSNCSSAPGESKVWASSVKVVLPAWCAPPCSVVITAPGAPAITVVANRPDVWWAASGWPLGSDSPIGPSIAPVLSAGGTLRVFGRALAWAEDGTCVNSAAQPGAVRTTTLTLTDAAGTATAAIPSEAASCYEATFELPLLSGPTGELQAVLVTPWGSSPPFRVIVEPRAPAPAPVPPTLIDVLKDCGGDLALAMHKAAASTHGPGAIVILGEQQRNEVKLVKPLCFEPDWLSERYVCSWQARTTTP